MVESVFCTGLVGIRANALYSIGDAVVAAYNGDICGAGLGSAA